MNQIIKAVSICAMAMVLSSCGGKIEATIGGTITGLSGGTTLTLQDNGGDNLIVKNNATTFTFATQIEAGSIYDVTILNQPAGETCFVENGVGTVEQSVGNVNSIVIVCNATETAANEVTGQITGLANGNVVTLVDNGTDTVKVTGSAAGLIVFAFPTPLALNAPYSVSVSASPSGQNCTVKSYGTGLITASGQVPNGQTSVLPVQINCM